MVSWPKYFSNKNHDLTLLGLFKPVYITLALSGIFPFRIKFKTEHTCVIIPQLINVNYLSTIIIHVVLIVFGVFHTQSLIQEITKEDDEVTIIQANYVVELYLAMASGVMGYVSTYLNRYKIVKILNALAATWTELPITKNRILENLRSRMLVSFFPSAFLLFVFIFINFTRTDGTWKMGLVMTTFVMPQALLLLALTFYNTLVLMLAALLRNIEEVLNTSRENKFTGVLIGSIMKVEPRRPQMNMRMLELVYVKTFKIKKEINKVFQATILLGCLQSFHSIITEAHFIYHGVFVETGISSHRVMNYTVWVLFQYVKVSTLAHSGNHLYTAVSNLVL